MTLLFRDPGKGWTEAALVLCDRHSSHCIPGSQILDTGRQRLLTAPKIQQKKGFSSLSCVLIQHPDAHRAERNPSIPFLIGWERAAAQIQSYIYRAPLPRVCLPRAGRTIHSTKPGCLQLFPQNRVKAADPNQTEKANALSPPPAKVRDLSSTRDVPTTRAAQSTHKLYFLH